MLWRPSLLLSAWTLACTLAAPARAGALLICYDNVAQPPWSAPPGAGLNFELLRRVEQQLGEQFSYAARPWRRCMEELRVGTVDAVIGAADVPERRHFAVYPTTPDGRSDPARALFEDNVYVFLRVGGQASWDGGKLRSPGRDIGVPSGYAIAGLVRQQGLHARDLIKSPEDGLRLLVSGMFDAILLEGAQAVQLASQDPRFQGKVRQGEPPYTVLQLHLPFNRKAYERDPKRIEAIWRAIARVRQGAEYRQLASQAAR